MKSLEQLLDFRELGPAFRDEATLKGRWFSNTFYNDRDKKVAHTGQVEIITIPSTNAPGRLNVRNGPPHVLQPKGGSKLTHSIFRQSDELPLDADALVALREINSEAMQEKGRQVVEIQSDHGTTQAALTKEVICGHIMTHHRVNFDADGNILMPSVDATTGVITDAAGTVVSADYGVPDSHRGNLDGIIDANWDVAGTRIDKQLDAIVDKASKDGVSPPNTIYMHWRDKNLLRNNTFFKEWATGHSVRVDKVLEGGGIDGLWGYNWRFLNGYYDLVDPATGAVTQYPIIPAKSVMILPPLEGGWLRAYEGSEFLHFDPKTFFLTADQAVSNLIKVIGQYAYAEIQRKPTQLVLGWGDNWGIGFAQPKAVWTPKVFT